MIKRNLTALRNRVVSWALGYTEARCVYILQRYNLKEVRSTLGTQLLHAPPTAHIVHSISSLAVAVDTLRGYNWRHRGNFSISIFNPPNKPIS